MGLETISGQVARKLYWPLLVGVLSLNIAHKLVGQAKTIKWDTNFLTTDTKRRCRGNISRHQNDFLNFFESWDTAAQKVEMFLSQYVAQCHTASFSQNTYFYLPVTTSHLSSCYSALRASCADRSFTNMGAFLVRFLDSFINWVHPRHTEIAWGGPRGLPELMPG